MRRYFAIDKEAKKKGAGVGNARYRGGGGQDVWISPAVGS